MIQSRLFRKNIKLTMHRAQYNTFYLLLVKFCLLETGLKLKIYNNRITIIQLFDRVLLQGNAITITVTVIHVGRYFNTNIIYRLQNGFELKLGINNTTLSRGMLFKRE
jgi:hypothetical protein